VIAILREHRHRLVATGRGGVLVFPSTAGTPLGVGNVRKRWHVPTLKRAGLSGVRLHDLRHTAATLWLAAGESIYFVKEQLGHADIQTTINLYGHPDQAEHRAAAERPAAWLAHALCPARLTQRAHSYLPAFERLAREHPCRPKRCEGDAKAA
jgi:integrase